MSKPILLSVVFTAAILVELVLVRAWRLQKDVDAYRSPWSQT